MKLALTRPQITSLVLRQVNSLFLPLENREYAAIIWAIGGALFRCKQCFEETKNKYYHKGDQAYFDPYHTGQYSIFLYFLANTIYSHCRGLRSVADRVYALNKALHGLDLFYEVEMPKVFFLDHPVGSVLGRAEYGERFGFAQGCTVGNNRGRFPCFGEDVRLMTGATVVGNCTIGNNVTVGAHTYLKDTNISSSSFVFGTYPNIIIKAKSPNT